MKAVTCLVILMALAYCVDGRERLGKIIKRQARHRDYKALQSPQAGLIEQSVVRNSFVHPQTQHAQTSEFSVPLTLPETRQAQFQQTQQQPGQPPYSAPLNPQYNQQLTSQAGQPPYSASPNPQYNQQLTSQAGQPPYSAPPNPQYNQQLTSQAGQPPYSAPPNPQYNQPPTSQGQQASYSEISMQQAMKSPNYGQALLQAYQTAAPWAQPIAMRDETNKILTRLPSNATLIRRNIIDGFSCQGRPYGYYADVVNECQIFHICFPLKAVFNYNPTVPDVTYEYSFICNEFTRFAQDSMTCAFSYETFPCADSESLYSINDHFFKITTPAPTGPISGSVPLPVPYQSTNLI